MALAAKFQTMTLAWRKEKWGLFAGAVLSLAFAIFAVASVSGAKAAEGPTPQSVLFTLQYIALDYANAVVDGAVVNEAEYREMIAMSAAVVQEVGALDQLAASASLARLSEELAAAIRGLESVTTVAGLANQAVRILYDEGDIELVPLAAPSPSRGRELYRIGCAACHGLEGGGDGPAADFFDPPASVLHAAAARRWSPAYVYQAIAYGIEPTAMPAFGEALTSADIWDLAFYTMSLRKDLRRAPPAKDVRAPTLAELARYATPDLERLLREEDPKAGYAGVDYYRLHPDRLALRPALAAPASDDPLEAARILEAALVAVGERARPSVFSVRVLPGAPSGSGEGDGGWRLAGAAKRNSQAASSAFFLSEDGIAVASWSALGLESDADPEALEARLFDGRLRMASLLGAEPSLDLAVLQVHLVAGESIAALRLGSSEALRAGQWAIAVSDHPQTGFAVTVGNFSSMPTRACYQEERSATLLQTTLLPQPRLRGSPLLTTRAEVVGVVVGISGELHDDQAATEGAHALPARLASVLAATLKTKGSRVSPWLGVSVLSLDSPRYKAAFGSASGTQGILIDDVFSPSPAAKAGLRPGDVLMAIDGQAIASPYDFQRALYLGGVGSSLVVTFGRGQTRLEATLLVEERPANALMR